ncbi:P-II family nitrogen regulator [uncultured Sphaerochaeta sp.]|uniref:P-II family nitrogen regulator n=1 Tax=uncultured Sphaerochaeta sp. TaxID=886478 RepID=UPI002A0A5231|nr:P-II family nitrogen regulator [uncultured Sphaerochaeta sp.]
MMYHRLVCIAEKNEAENLMTLAKAAGSTGGTIFSVRGTASSNFLSFLCLGDSRKEMLITVVDDQHFLSVFKAITEDSHTKKGLCLSLPCIRTYMNQTTNPIEGAQAMQNKWEMIQVICSSGYADDIMAAARKAGAGGGTIVDGRGTSKPDDVTFFGASLVPEKEMLMIVVEQEKAEDVFSAIVSLPCLQQPGSGIAYSLPVEKFANLGHSQE